MTVLQHSASNATASLTPRPKGVHFIDETADERVVVFGEVDMGISEDAEIKYAIGRRDPVRAFTRVGGYEGSATGFLIDYDSLTADEYRQRLEALKGKGHRHTLRLVFHNYSFPIIIGAVECTPAVSREGIDIFEVSVEFYQIGEFFEAYL